MCERNTHTHSIASPQPQGGMGHHVCLWSHLILQANHISQNKHIRNSFFFSYCYFVDTSEPLRCSPSTAAPTTAASAAKANRLIRCRGRQGSREGLVEVCVIWKHTWTECGWLSPPLADLQLVLIHPSIQAASREWTVIQGSIWNSPLQSLCPFSPLTLWDHAETSYHLLEQLPRLPFWLV